MKKLLVAAIVVLMASPAFAAIQNVKVSGDITTTYLDRNSFDLTSGPDLSTATGTDGLKSQSVFVTQTRLRVDADLSDNVSTTVGLINERAWTGESVGSSSFNTGDTGVQLYLASVTMRELLYSPLTVTVGRQVFNYGNGLIIGDGGPNNGASAGGLRYVAGDLTERTAYDGVKAILDYKPLTIDMFYFKNDQLPGSTSGYYGFNEANSNAYGINANYQLNDPMNTVVEGYLFSRFDGKTYADNGVANGLVSATPAGGSAIAADKNDTLYVPGLRASTNPIKGLNVQGEVAWQLGQQVVTTTTGNGTTVPYVAKQEAEHRDAMAIQALASYTLPVLEKYKPTVNASFTYVSGDKDANENDSASGSKTSKNYSAWDEFNKNQGAGTIYNTLFPLTNMYIYSAGGSINPLEDVTVSGTWSDLFAAEKYGTQDTMTLLQPNGTVYDGVGFTEVAMRNKSNLGNEADVNLAYNYTEDVTFGVSLGWFMPGTAFTDAYRDTASQAIADVAVKF